MEDYFQDFCGNSSLWDTNIFLNSPYPKFSQCFQNTFLVWVPCGLFWMFLPNCISHLTSKREAPPSSNSRLTVCKTTINWVLCLLTAIDLAKSTIQSDVTYVYKVMVLSSAVKLSTFIAALVVGNMERKKGVVTSGFLFLFWLSMVITWAVPFLTLLIEQAYEDDVYRYVFGIAYWVLIVAQCFLHCFADSSSSAAEKRNGKEPCPEVYASFPSKLSFWWMNSLIFLGYKKTLVLDDLWDIRTQDQAENVIPQFEEIWKQEVDICKRYNETLQEKDTTNNNTIKHPVSEMKLTGNTKKIGIDKDNAHSIDKEMTKLKQPSLFKVILRLCGKDVLRGVFFRAIFDLLQFSNPILLGLLISYVQSKSTEHAWKGYILAFSFYINAIVMFCLVYNNDINMDGLIMKLKTTLTSAVYKKSLKMDNKTKRSSTAGEIVNLMSVDCARLHRINWTFMFCASVPFRFVLCIFILYNTIGPAVFAGLTIMVLLIPINTIISRKQNEFHKELMKHKDERSKLMSEILNGIKVLKFYVWEPSFQQKIEATREKEINVIKKLRYLDTSYVLTFALAPYLVALISFTIYIFYQDGNYLDAGTAFMTLSLFDNLKFPLFMFPHLLTSLTQARVSMGRISEFLQSGEIDPENVQHKDIPGIAIKVEKGRFSWDERKEPTLKGIDLEIPKGKLIAIVGQVGMGKSSLLSAFLGEMDRLKGNVNITGYIGYVAQQAWIQNAKLKDNILFGKQLDQEKYNTVIDACSLRADLEMLTAGDNTEIGEKGINLSGGQKQRLNLARAVYYNADIYLMDDPLSAVDSHVGRHIFDKVIGENGLLKNKTRVLVTHGVHWLPKVDGIVVMKDGQISETGTYEELVNHDGAFAQFLKTYHSKPCEEIEDEETEDNETNIWMDKLDSLSSTEGSEDVFVNKEEYPKKHSVLFDRLVETLDDSIDIPSSTSAMRRRHVIGRSISHFDDESKLLQTLTSSMNHKNKEDRQCDRLIEKGCSKIASEQNISKENSKPANMKGESVQRPDTDTGNLIDDEETEIGQVKFNVYKKYFEAYGYLWIILIFLAAVINEMLCSSTSIVLSRWTDDPLLQNTTLANTTEYKSRNFLFIALYAGVGLGNHIFDIAYVLAVFLRSIVASKRLHAAMLRNVLRCPMAFFDTTPVGRILNRFTSDIDKIDNGLPHQIRGVFCQVIHVIITLIVISYNTPMFMTVIVPAIFLYRLIQKYYVPSIRQLERLHSNSNPPVISHFGETIAGVSTIRAYGLQDRFIKELQKKNEASVLTLYALICGHKWSGLRLEFVGNLFVVAAALFAVMSSDISGSVAGLCVAFALQITGSLNGLVHNSARLEINAISVERIKQYSEKETEAELVTKHRPPTNWPSTGNISIQDYQTRYRPGLDLVLKGITCDISGGEKVGVVGRTGAGKSSLMSALFRLIESADGKIEIDGQNIADMGLHDLRTKLTILPQDPVLFSGTLRMNLDPFDNYSNDELWTALEHAHLKKFVSELSDGLQYECGEGGQNLSVGQRQLVCLARALLHKTKILILDEATAAVDMETDDLIQKTIRTEFKDCTILAIAHRLNTIIDYDKALVLGQGLVLEYDTPENLLKNKQSVFYGMAKDSNLV